MIWESAGNEPVAAYYEPCGSDEDNKPRWVVAADGQEIPLENAIAWMPIAAPVNVRIKRPPEGNEIGDGNSWEWSPLVGWTVRQRPEEITPKDEALDHWRNLAHVYYERARRAEDRERRLTGEPEPAPWPYSSSQKGKTQ
jgi:hypothetical protein